MHFSQLRPHPVVLPEVKFSAQTRGCCQSEVSEEIKLGGRCERSRREGRETRQKMPRRENPEVFKSSSVCLQEHDEELTPPRKPQRGGEKLARVSRKIPEIPPEQQPGGSWKCVQHSGLAMDGM